MRATLVLLAACLLVALAPLPAVEAHVPICSVMDTRCLEKCLDPGHLASPGLHACGVRSP